MSSTDEVIRLTGDALRAARHRGSHMQIIACAGSGKTETLAQRVALLIAEGVEPRAIVAFTFTERAAGELKERIATRVRQLAGRGWEDKLTGLFVGTIHAFCFRLLQTHVARYETYDVLDDNRLTAFLAREGWDLGLDALGDGHLYRGIGAFIDAIAIVEDQLIPPSDLPEPLRGIYSRYRDLLHDSRLLSYGQQIVGAVAELATPEVRRAIQSTMRHLIVDEYQDVNPAQEELIRSLVGPATELCVVGDDDQAIYQWRGSDVDNILGFNKRWKGVVTFSLVTNYRSRAQIVTEADQFARSIAPRLSKKMTAVRDGTKDHVVCWYEDTEMEETARIAELVDKLHEDGVPYSDIAVLARSSTSFPALVTQLSASGIPVRPAGLTGLFLQPEVRAISRAFLWLTTTYRAVPYAVGETFTEHDVLDDLEETFELANREVLRVRAFLKDLKAAVPSEDGPARLVGDYYEMLRLLGVAAWKLDDPVQVGRLGSIARFGNLLADYESITRRARPDRDRGGSQRAGRDRGEWYYKNLAEFINGHGAGAYTDFGGEDDATVDAIDLTTIHKAKGLEWPVVFIPSLTSRFAPKPSNPPNALVGRDNYDWQRYAGSDTDERRVFYVALTRGREWVSCSRHSRPKVKRVPASPYYDHLRGRRLEKTAAAVRPPRITRRSTSEHTLTISFSEIASFLTCGLSYRLRARLGFPSALESEIGYGKAIHHVLRRLADLTKSGGVTPSTQQIDRMLDESFFLPLAGSRVHQELKVAARNLIEHYVREFSEDLHRVWESERAFELRIDGATVAGRADAILDYEGEVAGRLALLDYKSASGLDLRTIRLQLQVYALAGKREGLDVVNAYVHDLKSAADGKPARISIPVGVADLTTAEETVNRAITSIRRLEFDPLPGDHCSRCDVRKICRHATVRKERR